MEMDEELDPRIQIELENLNTATDEINKLEIELEEANATFRILLNESTRRLKVSAKKLGSSIEKSRAYYDALEKARLAQIECQKAAVLYQRASEIHSAAKETVLLAEQRFMSNSHEWQFDNAWQEMLNHATIKVMDAEKQKADSGAFHHEKTVVFNAAELKVQQLEQRFKSSIQKSRPYFEEKQICQDQLQTQKERIQQLQSLLQKSKSDYSNSLKNLELISESIHKKRGDLADAPPSGVREPGVGAEADATYNDTNYQETIRTNASSTANSFTDFNLELDKCELRSLDCHSMSTSMTLSDKDQVDIRFKSDDLKSHSKCCEKVEESDVEALRMKVKSLAVRPIEGGDGKQDEKNWENELNATVDRLDHLMLMREKNFCVNSEPLSLPESPVKQIEQKPIKHLLKIDPLPLANVSLQLLPTTAISASPLNSRVFNEATNNIQCDIMHKKRKLSLQ